MGGACVLSSRQQLAIMYARVMSFPYSPVTIAAFLRVTSIMLKKIFESIPSTFLKSCSSGLTVKTSPTSSLSLLFHLAVWQGGSEQIMTNFHLSSFFVQNKKRTKKKKKKQVVLL